MVEVNRESPLFDKFLPLQIQQVGELFPLLLSESSNRQTTLVFRVLQGSQPTSVIGQNEIVYHFEITDDRDPYFIYYFDVGEQSFPSFKREQSILVDFNVFPHMLIELLELCLCTVNGVVNINNLNGNPGSPCAHGNVSNAHPNFPMTDGELAAGFQAGSDSDSASSTFASSMVHALHHSTYTAKLDVNTGIFSIIESNKFKQITNISLPFRRGDDAAIKLYLSSRLGLTLDIARRQTREIEQLSNKYSLEQELTEKMEKELHMLRTQKNVDIQSLQASHSQELSTLQRSTMETTEQMRIKYESQLSQLRDTLEKTQQELHNRTMTMEQQISDLNHDKGQFEFKIRDITRQLQSIEQDRDRLLHECEEYHIQRRAIDDEKSTLQRTVLKLESKIEALQQQLKDREENMQKTIALQKASDEAKHTIEEKCQFFIQQNDSNKQEIEIIRDEIDKLQSIVNKLHIENKHIKDKMKLKNEVIRRQETMVNELRSKVVEQEQLVLQGKDTYQTANHQIIMLETRLRESNEKVEEFKKLLEEQKQVVAYLGEEVNRFQLGERLNAEPIFPKSSFLPPTMQAKYTSPTPVTPINAYTGSGSRRGTSSVPRTTPSTTDMMANKYTLGLSSSGRESVVHALTGSPEAKGVSSSSLVSPPAGPVKSHISNMNYLIQDNKAATIAGLSTLPTASSGTDNALLMKGLKNLGLTAALKEQDLGFDVIHGLQGTSEASSSVSDAAYFKTSSTSTKRSTTGVAMNQSNKLRHSMNLEELDYYAVEGQTTTSTTAANVAAINANSQPYKYAWQSPDFGKD